MPSTALRTGVVACLLGSLLFFGAVLDGAGTGLAQAPPVAADLLSGNTLSAVVHIRRGGAVSGGTGLSRLVLQAYLRPGGSASVRVWSAARDGYTAPVERRWTLAGSRLCLGAPPPGPAELCAEIHIWGPRIAGLGTDPYVMLDGDLRPGNTIPATR